MKAAHYNDIGCYLKDSRESLRLSVADAAQAMHIRSHYIDALETGNLDVLPGKAYVRGYIKNYALYLGIDPAQVLEAYDAVSLTVKRELYIPEPTVKENLPSRALMLLAVSAAVLLLGYYTVFRGGEFLWRPTVADVPPQLLLEAQASKDPRAALWRDCLISKVNECFNMLKADEVLRPIEKDFTETFNMISQMGLLEFVKDEPVKPQQEAPAKPPKEEEPQEEETQ